MVTISGLLVWKLFVLFMCLLYHISPEKYSKTRNFSNYFQPIYRPVRLWLVDAQAFHEPAVLLGRQRSGFPFRTGPLEAAGFQPLVKQHKSVAFPVQCLDTVPASTAKQEQGVGERVQIELLLNHGSQPVDATAQVGIAAGNINPVSSGEVGQHDFSSRSTVSTVAVSAPE